MDIKTPEDLKKLRVVDLKERLSKLGKSTSGLKADLVARLHGALAEQAGQVDLNPQSSVMAGYSQVGELPELPPMNPEPPVVEVTIDTSQFDCGVVEPQIVHDLYYEQQQQQQEEAERIQAMLHRQQQEEEMQRQQEEVERQRLIHEQILMQRQQEQEAELQRQREAEESQRLEQEERARWQQEEEYRRLEEAENLRLAQEEEKRRQEREMEEAERQRQELQRVQWQQEEEYRQLQEAELLRQQQAAEIARQEAERAQQEYEEAEKRRQLQEEAERIRLEEEAASFRLEQEEAERYRLHQEAERFRLQQEAERFRLQQEAERIQREREEAARIQHEREEAERIQREREEAERIQREREEAERIQREREEAARIQREREKAERIQREREDAERIQREREEASRIQHEREKAERIQREREEAERIQREQEEAERIQRELEAEQIRREQEEAERIQREREEAELIQREREEAERVQRHREETERIQREREEAERIQQEREEAERLQLEREEADRLQREREFVEIRQRDQRMEEQIQLLEAERIQREEAERVQREDEERKRREREQAELMRLEKEKAEKLKLEQDEAERKRIELEREARIKREKEEAERRRLQQEEAERLRKEREKKKMEEEEERLRKKRLEEAEKERLHQEYLDKQTAAALIQIPVQVPVQSAPPPQHEGMHYQPMMSGMGQAWPPVAQLGFPPPMVLPPPIGMTEAPPGYGVPHFPGEIGAEPPHSSSPPPIPGLGPPSPSQGKLDLAKPPSLMSLDLNRPSEDGLDDDMRLPQALEKVLAYKMERAQMLGVDPDTIAAVEPVDEDGAKEAEDEGVELEDANAAANKKQAAKSMEPKPSKNKQRKLKKKKRARHRRDSEQIREISMDEETGETEPDVEVQYIEDSLDLNPTDPMYHHFMKIFEAFKLTDPEVARREAEEEANRLKLEQKKEPDLRKKPKDADEDLEEDMLKKEEQPKLSKRKLKKLNRLSIAELKQHVNRPDVVEMHDVTAKDPRLLVILKSTRNTVPVPRHWCFKRKFLQGKRGIEKPPFDLPDFIKKTGIMEMRQALQEKEDQKTLKAKMRERVRPKMGKIDIDYQKLHDAFFKWQTKPKMTIHGDLYYEGKEFETRLKEKKPGELSDDLRTALGMPVGPNSQKVPPPWLIAMQRYGPPPSYPNLKIPGLNSPIPDGCSFGYHAGGWGKPPVDEMGKPLYGDVFGMQGGDNQTPLPEEEVDRTLWGELESESESESEEEDEEEEEEEEDELELDDLDKSGFVTPAEGGLATPSGISSIPMGMETPDMIELRKRKIESEMEGGETPALYTILPEKKTDRLGSAMMGSTHIYDIAAAVPGRPRLGGFNTIEGGVDVALDPSELDLDAATMTARYEQTLREQQNQLEKEDLSDMVAEHSAKQKNKRKRAAGEPHVGRAVKKYKDFKF